MNIKTLRQVLPILKRNKIVPFIWGAQGIGKTQVVKQDALASGGGFVHLHLATQEVGDLVGLLVKGENGTVYHARPEWFPTEGHGTIFLDELNRMHPDVMQAMFSFITDGTIHRHKLPEGWSIVAAGNYDNTKFQVTDTSDVAWRSRFCHLDLQPTVDEFIVYAEACKAESVASFIRDQPRNLEAESAEGFDFNTVTPDRRTWLSYVAKLEAEEMEPEARFELYKGLIGPAASAAFLTHKKTAEKSLTIGQILLDYSKHKTKVEKCSMNGEARFDYLNGPVSELISHLSNNADFLENKDKVENLKQFLQDIPLELTQRVFKDLRKLQFKNKDSIMNDATFLSKVVNKREG